MRQSRGGGGREGERENGERENGEREKKKKKQGGESSKIKAEMEGGCVCIQRVIKEACV